MGKLTGLALLKSVLTEEELDNLDQVVGDPKVEVYIVEYEHAYEIIGGFCVWTSTKQGASYWRAVRNRLQEAHL